MIASSFVLTHHADRFGAPEQFPKAVAPWQKQLTLPRSHHRGLRWPPLVLPNNFFFFLRTDPAQFDTFSLSHVLHSRHELIVSYSGRAKAVVNDQVFVIEPRTAHWIRPGEFHLYFDFEEEPLHWLFFSFDLHPESKLMPRKQKVAKLWEDDFNLLDEAGALYIQQSEDGLANYPVAEKMASLLERIGQGREAVPPVGSVERDEAFFVIGVVRKIATYVSARMAEGVQVDDLAEHLGLSEGYLRKLFRDQVGQSLGAWIRSSRFARALQLLVEGELGISEIATQAGFENVHSFSQAFNKRVGTSPTAFRKHLHSGGRPFKNDEV